jgi:hypothetical protein
MLPYPFTIFTITFDTTAVRGLCALIGGVNHSNSTPGFRGDSVSHEGRCHAFGMRLINRFSLEPPRTRTAISSPVPVAGELIVKFTLDRYDHYLFAGFNCCLRSKIGHEPHSENFRATARAIAGIPYCEPMSVRPPVFNA